MNILLQILARNVLITLELRAAVAAVDAGIHKKILGSRTTTPTISNEEMEDIMKIVKSLKCFGLLIKCISKTIQNKAKKIKSWISWYVIRCIRCKFIRKYADRTRSE